MEKSIAEKLWLVLKPLVERKKKKVGRPEFDNRKAFLGILFVLENGIKWRCLPNEYGKVSTVHGKFMRWVGNKTINTLFESLRTEYRMSSKAFSNWYAIDTSSSKAPYAKNAGRNPTDRGKRGIKKNIVVDSWGAPLAISVAPAHRHDSKTLIDILPLINSVKKSPLSILAADSAYDAHKLREQAIQSGFILHATPNKRRSNHFAGTHPKGRWIVERSHSWLNNFRSVKTCFAKYEETFLAFLHIAASIQLFRML